MRRQHTRTQPLPPTVALPTGNVTLLPSPRAGRHDDSVHEKPDGDATDPRGGWQIRDGEGVALGRSFRDRSEAIREMSLLAFRGESLPLILYGPDGSQTGDRLA